MRDNNLLVKAVKYIEKYGYEYKLFKKVPELQIEKYKNKDPLVAVIDLETTGLDHKSCKIIEIGIIIFSITKSYQFVAVHEIYNELNNPGEGISEHITKITGITNSDVNEKAIDWFKVINILKSVEYIICHNASFDRKFLESQTPESVANLIKTKKFGCTKNDINWSTQGFANTKLDYLNWASGYFYDAHRAINDCWATLNIINISGSIHELITNVNQLSGTIRILKSDYKQKDIIKSSGYRWNPDFRCWEKSTVGVDIDSEIQWVQKQLGGMADVSIQSATDRYSVRDV